MFNVVPGFGETAGAALGLHPDVDCAAFTGSTEVGRYFLEYSARSNLKEVLLECGGKSPVIVMADADDLEQAAAGICEGIFWNAGQNCSANSRLIVQRSVEEELTARTGPNTSSRARRLAGSTPVNTVGSTKNPPLSSRTRLPPSTQEAPASTRPAAWPGRRCSAPSWP